MTRQLQATTIVRQRGQLTIPEPIRRLRKWITPQSAVTISSPKPDEIVIHPATLNPKEYDWDRIWKNIELARSFKGKNKTSLSKFIAKDRQTRR